MKLHIWKKGLLILSIILFGNSLFAQPIVLDLQYSTLSFTNSSRSVVVNNGNGGSSQGSVHRYNNIVTKNGITVYGLLTVQEVNNAAIRNFDDDVTFGIPSRFQPRIGALSDAGGYIVYHLQFFNSATNQDIFLYNYFITGVDVDGNSSSNREFNEHGGFTSYTVNNPSQMVITTNASTGRTRFLGRTTSLNGLNFENTASYIINYTNPNNVITFALGQTRENTERHYSLQFGPAGGSFTNPTTTTNPLPLAIDDVGTPINSNTGGTAVANILSNDLYNGLPVVPSQVSVAVIDPGSEPGIFLNTSTGAVTVAPGTPAGSYTLMYQICMNADPPDRCDLAVISVRVLESDLSITKIDSPDPVIAGNNITYTITVNNNGSTEAQNVQVTDVLPSGLTFISATPSVGTWSGSTWNIGSLENGGSPTLILVAKVASNFTGSISNSASVTTTTYDPEPSNNSATQSTLVNSSANLSIVKTDTPDPALAGQNITYSITVSNSGPSDAVNIVATDNLPIGLTLVNATTSDGSWDNPNWSIGTLTSGSSATLTLVANINSNATGTISNTATVISSTPDPDSNNNSATQATSINSSADLSITKNSNVDPLIAGDTVIYSIDISNNGPSDAQLVQLTDNVSTEFLSVEFSIDGGSNWNTWVSPYLIGTINSGANSIVLVRGLLKATATHGSVLSNTALVNSRTPDPNTANNTSVESINISTRSDMSIVKTGPASIIAGTKITYSLTVINNGPSYASTIVIADAVPSGITNAEYSLNNGNSWGVWNGTRNLPLFNYPGSNNILIRGDVSPNATGSLVNTATVSSSTVDPDNSNNQSTVTTTILNEADLILSKTETISPLQKNGPINYVISVLNNGPTNAYDVDIVDNIDAGVIANAEYYDGSTWLTWTGNLDIGTLKKDSTYLLQIRGTVTNNASDPVVNTASVVSSTNDPNLANNSETILTALNKEADLSIVKSGPSTVNAGDSIQYTITVTNNSPNMDAELVLVTDNIDISRISGTTFSTDGGVNWSTWAGNFNIGDLNFGDSYSLIVKGKVLVMYLERYIILLWLVAVLPIRLLQTILRHWPQLLLFSLILQL